MKKDLIEFYLVIIALFFPIVITLIVPLFIDIRTSFQVITLAILCLIISVPIYSKSSEGGCL